jgi:hypothetical protein
MVPTNKLEANRVLALAQEGNQVPDDQAVRVRLEV